VHQKPKVSWAATGAGYTIAEKRTDDDENLGIRDDIEQRGRHKRDHHLLLLLLAVAAAPTILEQTHLQYTQKKFA
tara:strand:+ start:822 stop:1046 length:225 start_codon:yes stop_codon:yes gene_type:complete